MVGKRGMGDQWREKKKKGKNEGVVGHLGEENKKERDVFYFMMLGMQSF